MEVITAECLPMNKEDRLPVGLFGWRDIHIRHLQRLQVAGNGKELNRIGILVFFQANAESRLRFRRFICHKRAPFGEFTPAGFITSQPGS
jgi:hypothetical protein